MDRAHSTGASHGPSYSNRRAILILVSQTSLSTNSCKSCTAWRDQIRDMWLCIISLVWVATADFGKPLASGGKYFLAERQVARNKNLFRVLIGQFPHTSQNKRRQHRLHRQSSSIYEPKTVQLPWVGVPWSVDLTPVGISKIHKQKAALCLFRLPRDQRWPPLPRWPWEKPSFFTKYHRGSVTGIDRDKREREERKLATRRLRKHVSSSSSMSMQYGSTFPRHSIQLSSNARIAL